MEVEDNAESRKSYHSFRRSGSRTGSGKGISFSVKEGEILGIVGESGSGKTMTALPVMGLLKKHAFLDSGNIYLENLDLLQLNEKQMRTVQGNDISMIFRSQ